MSSIDFEILSRFREISRRLLELQKEVLSDTKITIPEFKMMTVLGINEKYNQTILSDFCDIDKPTTSRLINKMVEQNLVERKNDNIDRRITYINLSSEGKKILNELINKMMTFSKNYFNPISDNDKKTFINLLNKTLGKEEIC